MSFANLGLSKEALRAVKALGFEKPTPIQEQAIPEVLNNRDIIAAASTGTGKTAAFLLPLVSSLTRPQKGPRPPRILIVTPTRELAEQIAGPAFKIARACGQFVTTVFGGTPYAAQIRNLRRGTDILIATPGRLCDLMDRGVCDLSSIEALVLDEADRMLDMGFLPDIRRIVSATPPTRQTLLFSATIDAGIRNNFEQLLREPVVIQIAQRGQTADLVEQYIIPVAQKDKSELLCCLLSEKEADKVIVFARTKGRVQTVCSLLEKAGFSAVSIHSDKTQGQRREALSRFRKGKAQIIVATDVLARGIDVPQVDYVVNYDLPDMAEDYVHRIGRTGRAGEEGFAVSFVSSNSLKALNAIERLIGKAIPVMRLDSFDIDMGILRKAKRSKNSSKKHGKGQKKTNKGAKNTSAKGKRAHYDYTGYGDLRKGKPHKASKKAAEHTKGKGARKNTAKRSGKRPGWKSSSISQEGRKNPAKRSRKNNH